MASIAKILKNDYTVKMTYSLDFRRKVLSVQKEKSLTLKETAERFAIGIATVARWHKRIETKPSSARTGKIDKAALLQDVKQYPDAYQYERAARFKVCQRAICKALKKLGITYKKTLRHPKANEDARHTYQEAIKVHQLANRPIVYIDESGFALDMPRTHGYAPQGKRCMGIKDWQAKGRINVIGALLGTCLLTVALFECNIDSDVFYAWVSNDLLPKLAPATVLIMDNATFHKRQDTKQAIKEAGHILEFLPPYSPELNPIENKWAQAKSIRRATQCSIEVLFSEHSI